MSYLYCICTEVFVKAIYTLKVVHYVSRKCHLPCAVSCRYIIVDILKRLFNYLTNDFTLPEWVRLIRSLTTALDVHIGEIVHRLQSWKLRNGRTSIESIISKVKFFLTQFKTLLFYTRL